MGVADISWHPEEQRQPTRKQAPAHLEHQASVLGVALNSDATVPSVGGHGSGWGWGTDCKWSRAVLTPCWLGRDNRNVARTHMHMGTHVRTCIHLHTNAHMCTHTHTCTHLHTLTLPLVTKSFICILCKQLVQKRLPLFKGEFNKKEKSRHLGKILFKKKKEGREKLDKGEPMGWGEC